MPTFAEEFQAQLVSYLSQPDVKDKIRIALAGQQGKLTRLFEGMTISEDVKQKAYKEATKAGSKGMHSLLIEMVTQASSTLLSRDKMDLSDEIKPFFDLHDQEKDIVIDNLLQGIAVLYSINFDEIFNKKTGFALEKDSLGKRTISIETENGLPTPAQDAKRRAYIDNVISPINSVMPRINLTNVLLTSSESLFSKIKNAIFSIFRDESKSLKNRTDNLMQVAEILRGSIAYVADDSKTDVSRQAFDSATIAINKILDKLSEIEMKMANKLPLDYNIELETICHELADAMHTNLVTVDIKEKQPLYKQILNRIREWFSPPKLNDQELAQKLIASDPVLKGKVALLKSKNQDIKVSQTAEPEKPGQDPYQP